MKIRALLVLLSLLFTPVISFAAQQIDSFHAQILPSSDGTFTVHETIDYDFGTEHKHGIFRKIPLTHQQQKVWYKDRLIDITVDSVTRDGVAEPYSVSNDNSMLTIRIGDANTTIIGKHKYVLAYTARGGLYYYDNATSTNKTELYWNVTGTEWDVPMQQVSATVVDPDGLFTDFHACYQGSAQSHDQCKGITAQQNSVTFYAGSLKAYEGFTIAQSLDPQKVKKQILGHFVSWYLYVFGLGLYFIVLIAYVIRVRFKFRTKKPIIPQYEPYDGLKPMYTGVLVDGRLDPKDITAAIVYMAQHGYLKIKKTDRKAFFLFEVDDYVITLQKPSDRSVLSEFEVLVLGLLFDDDATAGNTVSLGQLKKDLFKRKANARRIQMLRQSLRKDLFAKGYFSKSTFAYNTHSAIIIFAIAYLIATRIVPQQSLSVPLTIIGVIVFVSFYIVHFALRYRTHKGYEALNHLKGFKQFLSVTEKERYAFHNAPTKSPEQFMEFLPYAIAFGVEKEWAKTFKDVTILNPDWYDGGTTGATFSALSVSNSIGAFSSAFSSSSGSSGASGGGGVGGGAGGGGGGSW